MRPIDADTVVTIQVYDDTTGKTDTKKMTIADAIDEWSDEGCPPTIEAEPVRHGHWIDHTYKYRYPVGRYECSICGAPHDMEWYYCPNCGAKMDAPTQKSVGKALAKR